MSILKRKNSPYWFYDVKVPKQLADAHGYDRVRFRGSTREIDRSKALQVEARVRLEILAGTYGCQNETVSKPNVMTLERCLDKTHTELWVNHKSANSFYRKAIQGIVSDSISKHDITVIDGSMLNEWVQEKLKVNSRSTVNQKLGIIQQAFDRASKVWGYELKVIDWRSLRLKKATKQHSTWFDEATERRIHKYFLDNGRQDIVDLLIVLADVGSRFSKTVEITTNQIDFDRRTIRFNDTKNGDDIILPLTDRALNVFTKYRHKRVPFDHLTYTMVRLAWDKMRVKFGWPSRSGYKIHALRHTCGTRLGKAGVDIRVIQQWLGHRDIRQTARYTQVVAEQLENARDKLEGKL